MRQLYTPGLLSALLFLGAASGCALRAHAVDDIGSSRVSKGPTEVEIGGLKFRLVAIAQDEGRYPIHLADHAWTPDGQPYQGPEARLRAQNSWMSPQGGDRRAVVLEAQEVNRPSGAAQPGVASPPPPPFEFDIFAYLPNSAANSNEAQDPAVIPPGKAQIWRGDSKDSSGQSILPMPCSLSLNLGLKNLEPQPLVVGIAVGDYTTIAGGPASIDGLSENQTTTLLRGSWGRVDVTHLPRPMAESKPSPTHRFQLLGGEWPPKMERRVVFLDQQGRQMAMCGDGANSAGYFRGPYMFDPGSHGIRGTTPPTIVRLEVQERPYQFGTLPSVVFRAPEIQALRGEEGARKAIDVPLGRVLGVLKPTNDGPWNGGRLFATDGTRWIDPGQELEGHSYGGFDPWNHPAQTVYQILMKPVRGVVSSGVPTLIEVHAADSPDGPNKESLTIWNELPIREPMTSITCKPTQREFINVEIRAGDGLWKTVHTIPVDGHMRAISTSGKPGTRVLEVFIHQNGAIRVWRSEENPVPIKPRWNPADQRVRAVAHLLNGEIIPIDFNMGGSGGVAPNLDQYRGFTFTRQQNGTSVQAGFRSIQVSEIAKFELQIQTMGKPEVFSVHTPRER